MKKYNSYGIKVSKVYREKEFADESGFETLHHGTANDMIRLIRKLEKMGYTNLFTNKIELRSGERYDLIVEHIGYDRPYYQVYRITNKT